MGKTVADWPLTTKSTTEVSTAKVLCKIPQAYVAAIAYSTNKFIFWILCGYRYVCISIHSVATYHLVCTCIVVVQYHSNHRSHDLREALHTKTNTLPTKPRPSHSSSVKKKRQKLKVRSHLCLDVCVKGYEVHVKL